MTDQTPTDRPLEGGCHCGAVRYSLDGPLGFSFLCQCRRCQKLTGSGHAPGVKVERAHLTVTGSPAAYQTPADSGHAVTHEFCPRCGAPLFASTAQFPDSLALYVASLDDPACFAPECVLFADGAQPWDQVDPALPKWSP